MMFLFLQNRPRSSFANFPAFFFNQLVCSIYQNYFISLCNIFNNYLVCIRTVIHKGLADTFVLLKYNCGRFLSTCIINVNIWSSRYVFLQSLNKIYDTQSSHFHFWCWWHWVSRTVVWYFYSPTHGMELFWQAIHKILWQEILRGDWHFQGFGAIFWWWFSVWGMAGIRSGSCIRDQRCP